MNYGFEVTVSEEIGTNDNFRLHNHNYYEIFIFYEGDSEYVVEGNRYALEPYDIIVINRLEMHRIYHNRECKYKRGVLYIYPEFFRENNCEEYEQTFLRSGQGRNKISREIVEKSGIKDALKRFEKYSDKFQNIRIPVCKGILIEILYLLSNIDSFEKDTNENPQIKEIISYINNHYKENLTLEILEKQFFMSKYHLCRIFKEATGLTIHSYITEKRMASFDILVENHSVTEAAELAGFPNYSAFYRVKKQKK